MYQDHLRHNVATLSALSALKHALHAILVVNLKIIKNESYCWNQFHSVACLVRELLLLPDIKHIVFLYTTVTIQFFPRKVCQNLNKGRHLHSLPIHFILQIHA